MRNTLNLRILLLTALLTAAATLTACAQTAAEPEAIPAAEPIATPMPVEATASPSPTDTPEPTPEPTPEVIRTLTIYGKEFSSADTEIDLSNIKIKDGGAELLELLDALPHLEKVIMCDCGLSDQQMDDLNRAYEDIRFVWMLHFSAYDIRTDTNFFMANTDPGAGLSNQDLQLLRYCPDIEIVDLGHKQVSDISFVTSLPHLRYLLLADSDVADITPVAELKELEYLELFLTNVTDLSPLLGCPRLVDLNLCYIPTSAAQSAYEVIMQMPWLERLFYVNSGLTQEQQNDIRDLLSDDASVIFTDDTSTASTGLGWRFHERYYEMRDIIGMMYMSSH